MNILILKAEYQFESCNVSVRIVRRIEVENRKKSECARAGCDQRRGRLGLRNGNE
jgi:hypothetical protein